MKYIIVDTGAVLIEESNTHSLVGEGYKNRGKKIYSAGFVSIDVLDNGIVNIKCHGHSESLNIDSQPEKDKLVIADLFSQVKRIAFDCEYVKKLYDGEGE